MGPIAVNRLLRRLGHRVAGVLAALVVVGAVVVHHLDLPGGGGHQHGAAVTVTVDDCIGAFVALGAVVVAVAVGVLRIRTPGPDAVIEPATRSLVAEVAPRARAGPIGLPVLCIWRI